MILTAPGQAGVAFMPGYATVGGTIDAVVGLVAAGRDEEGLVLFVQRRGGQRVDLAAVELPPGDAFIRGDEDPLAQRVVAAGTPRMQAHEPGPAGGDDGVAVERQRRR